MILFLSLLSASAALAQDTDSVIATEEDFIWLNEQLPNGFEIGDRLYRATLDGTKQEDFHSRCDDQGPTVVIVQVGNNVKFGGYADKSWTSTSQWLHSDEAFMFVLETTKFDREKLELTGASGNRFALHHSPTTGPHFGHSTALALSLCGAATCGGQSRLGDNYAKAKGGTVKYLTGRKHFSPYTDFEVFAVKAKPHESVIASVEDFQWLNGLLYEHGMQMGGLLYRQSTDGSLKNESGFHAKVDNKGPTVVIVEATNGVKFGGYADKSWTSTSEWLHSDDAFMFVLESNNYDREKLELTGASGNRFALHTAPNTGPHFGHSTALAISIGCANCGAQSRLGDNYAKAKGGTVKYLMGRKHFKMVDWEVFSVVS